MVKVPSLPSNPGVGGVHPVTQHEAILGELVGDGEHRGADPLVFWREEPEDGDQQQGRVQLVVCVVLAEPASFVDPLVEDLRLEGVRRLPHRSARSSSSRIRAMSLPRSIATQQSTLEAVKCSGSPRISQMP